MIQTVLTECYSAGSKIPAPDTLHYTLGEQLINSVWTQDRRPCHDLQPNELIGREISLSHDDKLEWITEENSTIIVFLPLPDMGMAMSPRSTTAMSDTVQQPRHVDVPSSWQSNPLPTQQQLHHHTPQQSCQGEPQQKSQEHDLLQEEIPPSSQQIFIRIPDTWTERGRKPTFTQTMPAPTSLDSLKDGISALLFIPTHHLRILYGGKNAPLPCPFGSTGGY